MRVCCKGSFLNSAPVKDFAFEMIRRGHRRFQVDLGECPVMDSTFMGTLAGIVIRLREQGGGEVRVAGSNPRNRELLRSLGLDHLLTVEAPGSAQAEKTPRPEVPLDRGDAKSGGTAERAKTMLEAHEALVLSDPANLAKFKDVIEYLRQDLNMDTQG